MTSPVRGLEECGRVSRVVSAALCIEEQNLDRLSRFSTDRATCDMHHLLY